MSSNNSIIVRLVVEPAWNGLKEATKTVLQFVIQMIVKITTLFMSTANEVVQAMTPTVKIPMVGVFTIFDLMKLGLIYFAISRNHIKWWEMLILAVFFLLDSNTFVTENWESLNTTTGKPPPPPPPS